MTKLIPIATAAAALALFGAAPAVAQGWPATDFDAALQDQYRQMGAMGAQMQGNLNQIQQGAMNDPAVQMGYRQFLAGGGQQDFATWALNYRATNGYDLRAVQDVYQQQAINTGNEQQAWNGYMGAQQNAAAAYANMQNGYAGNLNQLGMATAGQQFYTDPSGAQVALSYMPSAGPAYNGQTGFTYVPNGNGGYTGYDANGYAYQMPYSPW